MALLAACPRVTWVTVRMQRTALLPPRAPMWLVDGVAALLELRGMENVHVGQRHSGNWDEIETVETDVIGRELRRAKGEESGVRWVNGCMDL